MKGRWVRVKVTAAERMVQVGVEQPRWLGRPSVL
jgi:hypothetical protein